MKTCTVCKQELPYSEYHKSSVTKDGYGYRCKECDKKARAKYKEENRERFAEVSRRKQLKFKYGITLEEYNEILQKQNNACAICGTTENNVTGKNRGWNFAVDHDHETGEVRGLLCNQCNRGLGMLGDTVESLKKAIQYLETH